jgi:hypothetical protein
LNVFVLANGLVEEFHAQQNSTEGVGRSLGLAHSLLASRLPSTCQSLAPGRADVWFRLLPRWAQPDDGGAPRVHARLSRWPLVVFMCTAMVRVCLGLCLFDLGGHSTPWCVLVVRAWQACLLFSAIYHLFSSVSQRAAINFQSLGES